MHREGHIGAALVAYAPVGAVALALGFETLALVGAVAAGGLSMLPDYDQRVPGLDHRGPTHTVWFALVVGVVLRDGDVRKRLSRIRAVTWLGPRREVGDKLVESGVEGIPGRRIEQAALERLARQEGGQYLLFKVICECHVSE